MKDSAKPSQMVILALFDFLYSPRIFLNHIIGQQIRVPINASNVVLTKLRLTKDRQNLITRKCQNSDKLKGKVEAPKS